MFSSQFSNKISIIEIITYFTTSPSKNSVLFCIRIQTRVTNSDSTEKLFNVLSDIKSDFHKLISLNIF